MPPINDQARFIIWSVIGIAGIISTALLIILGPNIGYFLRGLLPGENQRGSRPTNRSRFSWWLFGICVCVTVFGSALVSSAPSTPMFRTMTGDFRIIVSSFVPVGKDLPHQVGTEIARSSYERIAKDILSDSSNLVITAWGPEDIKTKHLPQVSGANKGERAKSAAHLAETVAADVVIYGTVEKEGENLKITPEFFVRVRNFYEAEEITGQFELGSPIVIRDYSDLADRVMFEDQLTVKVQALSEMIIGLAYYSLHNDQKALDHFKQANEVQNWEPSQGKHVLYLLLGNIALHSENPSLDLAEIHFQKSLEIQPDYARALLGLSNVYYQKALLPVQRNYNPAALDTGLIVQSLRLLSQAHESPDQPPLADIPTKIHFELGQASFMLAYGGFLEGYQTSIGEFEQVIRDYGDGANPRIRQRAGEAHARLGLIAHITGDAQRAIMEYETAIRLVDNYPERQNMFKESLRGIQEAQASGIDRSTLGKPTLPRSSTVHYTVKKVTAPPPDNILREVSFSANFGGGGVCDRLETYAREVDVQVEWEESAEGSPLCGWIPGETVTYRIFSQDGVMITENRNIADESGIVFFGFVPKYGTPVGRYRETYSSNSETLERHVTVVEPGEPRLYVKWHDPSWRLILYHFRPYEHIRLYVYAEDVHLSKNSHYLGFNYEANPIDWSDFTVDQYGHLTIEIDPSVIEIGNSGPWFIILGEQSGEVQTYPPNQYSLHDSILPPAISFHAYHPKAEELAQSINIWNRVKNKELTQPGQQTYDLSINANEKIGWRFDWCASNNDVFTRYREYLKVEFIADGLKLNPSQIAWSLPPHDAQPVCAQWATLLQDWQPGSKHTLEIRYEFTQNISNGEKEFPMGVYSQIVNLQIN